MYNFDSFYKIMAELNVGRIVESLIHRENPRSHDRGVETESDEEQIQAILMGVYRGASDWGLKGEVIQSLTYHLDCPPPPPHEHYLQRSAYCHAPEEITLYYDKDTHVATLVRMEWDDTEECTFNYAVRVNVRLVPDGDYVAALEAAFSQ
jgi:hypothetical protein